MVATGEEFKRAGLSKLSVDELNALWATLEPKGNTVQDWKSKIQDDRGYKVFETLADQLSQAPFDADCRYIIV